MSQNEKLAIYRHNFDDLFRQQAHVRSAEVEEILGRPPLTFAQWVSAHREAFARVACDA